jgi:SAM-dependent methyltransferase
MAKAGRTTRLPPQPPGTLLQWMYVRGRLSRRQPGLFYELGAGTGELSYHLLSLGHQGHGFDLGATACKRNAELNASAIAAGRYQVTCDDLLALQPQAPADLVVSSMVLEHLPEQEAARYFRWCRHVLRPDGLVITLVPAGPQFWGIEDEIAGHLRRYTPVALRQAAADAGLVVRHLAGLTWPLSNLLLPLSNFLVRRAEQHKTALSLGDRTVESGARDVPFKTRFPNFLGLVLNEYMLLPFHVLQMLGRNSPSAMVLYCEMGLTGA